jgi:predicted lipid-binding transport protein (Tim44 family)
MKRTLISLFALFISLSFVMHDAEARRFGGGKSFGMQRSVPTKQSAAPTPQQQPGAAPATAPQKRSWMGPIAGLAAGLGLAALFSHLGMGEGMANFMMIAQHAAAAFDQTPAALGNGSVSAFPPGFDADAFAREAKLNFIRLQAAFDARNLDDIRAFTAPEIFAEISMQLAERGDVKQTTDVMTLNAEVLEAIDEGNRHIVSVRFTGLVREDADAAPVVLDEVWHLSKPVSGQGGWVIAGIQQQ